ncbi:unnamed protein product [Closterium sp. NIES-54]
MRSLRTAQDRTGPVRRCNRSLLPPATVALGRLLLPYLFPELSTFATVEDPVSHLRTSDARYHATVPAEFLDRNQPLMIIALYFIVTRLPDSLRSVRDHFLSLDPSSLTVDLLKQHLLAAETSAVAVGAARGTPRPPFFEGCSPSPLAPSYASAAAAEVSVAEDVGAASASAKRRSSKRKGGRSGGGGSDGGLGGSGSGGGGSSGGGGGGGSGGGSGGSGGSGGGSGGSGSSGGGGTGGGRTGPRRGGPGGGQQQQHALDLDFLRSGVAIFDLDFDDILSAMYALSTSAEGECYRCVPPDPGIAAAALGASESGTLPGTAPAEALHTFTLDSGASRFFFRDSTTLTPLPAPVPVRQADPSRGPVVARSSTVLVCLARVSICTCTRTGHQLATFTRRPGSSLYTLATEPPQVASSAQVSASGQVAASCSCRLLSHQTNLWHHRLGHPSLPHLRGMHTFLLVCGLPRSLPPLPPLPAPPCLPCVEGRQRAAAHSSSFPPTTAPVQTLHMDSPAPSGVSQVDPPPGAVPGEVSVDSGAARGTASGGAEPGGAEPGGAEPGGVESGGAQPGGAATGGAEPWGAETGGAESEGVEPGGAASEGADWCNWGTAATGPGGARTWGTGAAGTGGVGGARAGDPMESGAARSGGSDAGGAGARGAGVGGTGTGGAGAGGAGAVDPGGTPASPLLAPSPYTEQSGGLTECLRVPLPAPPESSIPKVPDPGSDRARAASPTVSCILATLVTDPFFESATASALVAELLDFAAACRLDYATALVAESACASPPSFRGECALGTDVLEDRQEDFECLATAVPRFASMLLAPEGDRDAPDIPTPRSYAEAITGPYSSQWQAAMDAEMASWKSTGTYVNEVPPPGANIVDGMWIFRVKQPPGSPPAFKARYVARGFSQRQGVDYFQTFSPTPKMNNLRVLAHVAAQRDYELHSLDFSTPFLQGSLHEEIWLRHPRGFTGSFPAGTQWSLRQPVYGLRQAPHEWHDTLRTTLAALGFVPCTADPSLFLRTNTSLPPFYVLVYVTDLVFATADTEALTWRRPALLIASPCLLSRCPAKSVASPCWPSHQPTACVSPYPARAEPPCCPHRPAARRPAARATLMLLALVCAALLAGALLPTLPCCASPCCLRRPTAAHPAARSPAGHPAARSPAGRRHAARTALLSAAPLPAPPCPAAALPTVRRPAGRRPASRAPPCYPRAALLAAAPPCPAHATPCWPPPCPTLAACHSSLAVRCLQTCRKSHTQHRCFSRLEDAWRAEFVDEAERPHWLELLTSGVDIFALDYDAILAAMYALSVSAKGDCCLCVLPDPGIEAVALGACEYAVPGTTPAEALHTFTLDSGSSRCFFHDSTTLTPLPARVPVRLADPSRGPVLARSSTVLPCLAVSSGSLSGLHLPSFSTNLVSTAAL